MVEASPSSLTAMEGMEVELDDLTWLGESEAAIFPTEAGGSDDVAGAFEGASAGEVAAGGATAGDTAEREVAAGE